ncbi:MAG: type II toxin-antitoxin system VapC family toxin [Terriglobia bacterium]
MIVYADTGFLISLYGDDDNSAAATALLKSKPVFMLTPLGEAEFMNAVELRVFHKQWMRRQAHAVREDFLQDYGAGVFQIEPLGPEVWQAALIFSRRHTATLGVRTLDLLHVAAVSVLKPDAFYSFDKRQRKVAKAERLPLLPA